MTGPEDPLERRRRPVQGIAQDPWSIWFSRLVQVVGLGLVVYEAGWQHSDRPVLLLVATAMMLGGVGLQMVLRWLLLRGGSS